MAGLVNFLRMFRDCHRSVVGRIRAALTEQKVELARRLSHSLKGGAGTVGLVGLQAAAERMEDVLSLQLQGIDNPARRKDDFVALVAAWARAQEALDVLLDGHTP